MRVLVSCIIFLPLALGQHPEREAVLQVAQPVIFGQPTIITIETDHDLGLKAHCAFDLGHDFHQVRSITNHVIPTNDHLRSQIRVEIIPFALHTLDIPPQIVQVLNAEGDTTEELKTGAVSVPIQALTTPQDQTLRIPPRRTDVERTLPPEHLAYYVLGGLALALGTWYFLRKRWSDNASVPTDPLTPLEQLQALKNQSPPATTSSADLLHRIMAAVREALTQAGVPHALTDSAPELLESVEASFADEHPAKATLLELLSEMEHTRFRPGLEELDAGQTREHLDRAITAVKLLETDGSINREPT